MVGPAEGGAPVKGYLDIEGIIAVATRHGVDAIHPGYGFLSENAGLARACAKAGIKFVGPTPEMLDMFGGQDGGEGHRPSDERADGARDGARADRSGGDQEGGEVDRIPADHQASFGGGGRGMRVVTARRS